MEPQMGKMKQSWRWVESWWRLHNKANMLSAVCAQAPSRILVFATPWTVAHQAPLSMGFSRQEYWSGLPCLPPGFLFSPGIEPVSPALVGGFFTTAPPGWSWNSNTLATWCKDLTHLKRLWCWEKGTTEDRNYSVPEFCSLSVLKQVN